MPTRAREQSRHASPCVIQAMFSVLAYRSLWNYAGNCVDNAAQSTGERPGRRSSPFDPASPHGGFGDAGSVCSHEIFRCLGIPTPHGEISRESQEREVTTLNLGLNLGVPKSVAPPTGVRVTALTGRKRQEHQRCERTYHTKSWRCLQFSHAAYNAVQGHALWCVRML
jgi:hypothetical protein